MPLVVYKALVKSSIEFLDRTNHHCDIGVIDCPFALKLLLKAQILRLESGDLVHKLGDP